LEEAAMRLTPDVRPVHYELFLQVDPERDDFAGDVKIEVEVQAGQSEVLLHARDLEVTGATRVDADLIRVDRPFSPGRHHLQLSFRGQLNPRLRGLYRSVAHDGRKLLVTQGEPNYARLIFPCFDEPAFKATFQLTVEIPEGLTAISNAAPLERHGRRVRFATTPKMSSYLVALVVGELEAAPAEHVAGVKLQLWTTPGRSHLVNFAHQVAAHSLRDYT
jgi:puromycin-sensitive aminopeptidase